MTKKRDIKSVGKILPNPDMKNFLFVKMASLTE